MAKRKLFVPDPATVRWAIRRVRSFRHCGSPCLSALNALADDLRETSGQIARERKAQAKKAVK